MEFKLEKWLKESYKSRKQGQAYARTNIRDNMKNYWKQEKRNGNCKRKDEKGL
ncbi:UNVERIFIED_ORG: hypothetical protein GCAPEGMB_00412 [Vibrio phage V07]